MLTKYVTPCFTAVGICLALLLGSTPGRAQAYSVKIEHWDQADGLPHRQINAILLDKKGFMWLATPGGLCRYDGYTFIRYSREQYGLPFTNLDGLAQDRAGLLWLAGNSGLNNLCIFNPATGQAVRPTGDRNHHFIFVGTTKDGHLLLASYDDGPRYWTTDRSLRLHEFPLTTPAGGAFRFRTHRNTLWFSQGDADLYEVSMAGTLLDHWKLPYKMAYNANRRMEGQATAFAFASTGDLYNVFDDKHFKRISYVGKVIGTKPDFVADTKLDGIILRQGRLYHPERGIIADLPAQGWDDLEGGIRNGFVRGPGDIWLGGAFGLYHLTVRRNYFTRLFFDPVYRQLPDNGYRGILALGDRVLAAQEVRGILSQSLHAKVSRTIYKGHNTTRFNVLKRLTDSSIVATSHQWIYRANKSATHFSVWGPGGDVPIWSTSEWDSTRLLLGTELGLVWFDRLLRKPFPFTGYGLFTQLQEATVNEITRLSDSTICICAGNGLYLMNADGQLTHRYAEDQPRKFYLPATRFLSCTPDGAGNCFLATDHGLIYWNRVRGTYRHYTSKDGLSNEVIYAACPDAYGKLWLPSDYGLMALDRTTGKIKNYLVEDGITANEFNRTSHYRGADGRLYFGSINGVTSFHPQDFSASDAHPAEVHRDPLVITACSQFDGTTNREQDRTQDLLRTQTIILRPEDRFVSIEFALLNYEAPFRTTYFWKMDGDVTDTGWIEQPGRTLQLSRLPYGRHTLHIQALSADGSRAGNQIHLSVIVEKPLYLRTGFLIGMLVLVLGITTFIFRARSYRLRRENRKLDGLVKERTSHLQSSLEQREVLLKEIHHRVRNNLQVISSLIGLQSQSVNDLVAKEALQEGQNRVLSIALVHQMLYQEDELNAVELHTMADKLFAQLQSIYSNQRVALINHIPEQRFAIPIAVPLGLILNELFTNSFKHAFSTTAEPRISLDLTQKGNLFFLTYLDNGSGIANSEHSSKTTLGINLINILTRQLRGTMTYNYNGESIFTITFRN